VGEFAVGEEHQVLGEADFVLAQEQQAGAGRSAVGMGARGFLCALTQAGRRSVVGQGSIAGMAVIPGIRVSNIDALFRAILA
jgi:hypothetical protein